MKEQNINVNYFKMYKSNRNIYIIKDKFTREQG